MTRTRLSLLSIMFVVGCSVYDASLLASAGGDGGAQGGEGGRSEIVGGSAGVGGPAGRDGGGGSSAAAGTPASVSGGTATSGGTGGTATEGGTAGAAIEGGTPGELAGQGGGPECEPPNCCAEGPDGDSDGSPDCRDACPADPGKVEPGACGCGVPDEDTADAAGCIGLREALLHRYSFGGTGARVSDSVGSAHGNTVNAQLSGTGTLTLAGGQTDQYVDLPNGLLSTLKDVTIETWISWQGGSDWQRIFDFGSSNSSTEGAQGSGASSFLFFAARTESPDTFGAGYLNSAQGSPRILMNSSAPLPVNVASQVAVVFDDTNNSISVFLNGDQTGALMPFSGVLAAINDRNNWLGRSQFSVDDELSAQFDEFRIYGRALSEAQLQLSSRSGPNPAFLDY